MYPGDHDPDGVPLIKAGDLNGSIINPQPDFRISKDKHYEYRRTALEGGELLMTLVGNVGQCAVVPPRMAGWNTARAVAVMRLSDSSETHFVQQCLLSRPLQHLMDVWCNTTVQATLNLKEIRQLPLPWPPKQSRDAIAAFGRALDDKIELNRRMNATLEAMARALFQSWFVDFDPVRAKLDGRLPVGMDAETAAMFPAGFDEYGRPEGWSEKRVDEIMVLAYGKALKSTIRVDGSVPVYGSGGLTGFHNQALEKGPSIIVGRKGTVGSLYWEDRPFYPIDTVFYVQPIVPLTFCFYLLQTLGLENLNTDAAVPGLNRNNVYRLPVPWAGTLINCAFDRLVTPIRQKIYANAKQSRTLATLRDTLLPKLLSGELSVAGASAELTAQ